MTTAPATDRGDRLSCDMFANHGYCPCCDAVTQFVASDIWWRDTYRCMICDSIPRERALMYCIEKLFPLWRGMVIHESSPVDRGASLRLRTGAPGYIPSHFYPGVPSGETVDGMRCEDLEKLGFGDDSVDLHVTQDVFEHLLDPAAAFREIARTLRPGGAHVFTTPLSEKARPTQFCARRDRKGDVIHLHYPPEYHRNPVDDSGSLLTVRWGYDITDYIERETGLASQIILLDILEFGIRAELVEVIISCKPKGRLPRLWRNDRWLNAAALGSSPVSATSSG